jgi:outer membrane protein TolC
MLAAAAAAGRLAAQDPSAAAPARADDPVLASLIEEALARSPDLLAARETIVAARTKPDQARALPPTDFSVLYTNDGGAISLGERDMTTLAFVASQNFPWPGKRPTLAGEAECAAAQVAQVEERLRLSTIASVKRAYYGLALARQILSLVNERGEVWRDLEGVTRARYAVGQGVQQDVLRVQIEVTRVEQEQAEQEVQIETLLAELNRLRDRDVETPIETPAVLGLVPEARSLPELIAWTESVSPELRSAGIDVDRERLAEKLASLGRRPDVGVTGGYMYRGALDPMWLVGFSLALPTDTRRARGEEAEARARASSATHRKEAIRATLRARTKTRLVRLRSAERIASLYEKGIIPQDQMSVESALANYRAGKIPFLTVLEALRTLYGDRSTQLVSLAGHAIVAASLEEASLETVAALPDVRTPEGSSAAITTSGTAAAPSSMSMR